jgi:hypothetical protein
VRPVAQRTFATFKSNFTLANTKRIRQTTAAGAGYHGANAANLITPGPAPPLAITAIPAHEAVNAAGTGNTLIVNVEGGQLYYCWTHGLGHVTSHVSNTCNHCGDGHIANANMQGGCTEIRMPDANDPRHPVARCRIQHGCGGHGGNH